MKFNGNLVGVFPIDWINLKMGHFDYLSDNISKIKIQLLVYEDARYAKIQPQDGICQ